jgi:hypothetical protein
VLLPNAGMSATYNPADLTPDRRAPSSGCEQQGAPSPLTTLLTLCLIALLRHFTLQARRSSLR